MPLDPKGVDGAEMGAAPSLPVKLPAQGVPANVAHVEEEGGVRRLKFSDDRINSALDKQLGKIPGDATAAVVATAFKDHDGKLQTKLAVYIKRPALGGELSFGGFLSGDSKRPLDTVGAEVSWVSR